MTMPMRTTKKCFVCKNESTQTEILSTNSFGSPDLDLRPPEMKRSTMVWWVQECPHCGYVASDLEDSTTADSEWLKSKEYADLNSERYMISPLAVKFYKQYLICKKENNIRMAYNAIVHCAWACDDCGDYVNADYCRTLAVTEGDQLDKTGERGETLLVQIADLLRRSKQFNEVIKRYEGVKFSEEILNQIIAFQIEKAKQWDTKCYTVEQAVESVK